MTALFSAGKIVSTPGAIEALASACVDPLDLLHRHLAGDWGDVSPADAAENEFSVRHGFRILSSYTLGMETRVWVVTEANRSYTTYLLPSEY